MAARLAPLIVLLAVLAMIAALFAGPVYPPRPTSPPTYVIYVQPYSGSQYDLIVPAVVYPNGSVAKFIRMEIEGNGTVAYAVAALGPAFRVMGTGTIVVWITYGFSPPSTYPPGRFPQGSPDLSLWTGPAPPIGERDPWPDLGNVSVAAAGAPSSVSITLGLTLDYAAYGPRHTGRGHLTGGATEVSIEHRQSGY